MEKPITTASNKAHQQIGIYGGTFNPVHNGHLLLARDVRERLQLDEVWLLPNSRSPLRLAEALAPAETRLKLLNEALKGESGLSVCDLEVKREGVSYTVETLEALTEAYPGVSWCFIVGADSLTTLDRWVRVEDLARLARLVVVNRPGFNLLAELEALENRSPALKGRVELLLESRQVDVSATEVRDRLRSGQSVRFLVPDAVAAYLEEHRTYS